MSLVARPAENHPQQVKRRGPLDKVDDRRDGESLRAMNDFTTTWPGYILNNVSGEGAHCVG